jgi:hypothetical protein
MTFHDTNPKIMHSINITAQGDFSGQETSASDSRLICCKARLPRPTKLWDRRLGSTESTQWERNKLYVYIAGISGSTLSFMRRLQSLQHCTNAKILILELQYIP